ncbi:hypothetical protein [Priestia megaterium]|uniref:hypothetical protein n=1 Tax=Priestia megaterium TaxID=1404 RepID=UPI002FFED338
MAFVESELREYNRLKCELFRICNCIDCCIDDNKEFYQDLAISYSTKLKRIEQLFFVKYGIKPKGIYLINNP